MCAPRSTTPCTEGKSGRKLSRPWAAGISWWRWWRRSKLNRRDWPSTYYLNSPRIFKSRRSFQCEGPKWKLLTRGRWSHKTFCGSIRRRILLPRSSGGHTFWRNGCTLGSALLWKGAFQLCRYRSLCSRKVAKVRARIQMMVETTLSHTPLFRHLMRVANPFLSQASCAA